MDYQINRGRDRVPSELLRRITSEGECSCGRGNEKPLAMVYAKAQEWRDIYDIEKAFSQGTIFAELDFPFYMTPCCRGGAREGRGRG